MICKRCGEEFSDTIMIPVYENGYSCDNQKVDYWLCTKCQRKMLEASYVKYERGVISANDCINYNRVSHDW